MVNSPNPRIAEAGIRSADAALMLARAALLPDLKADANLTEYRSLPTSGALGGQFTTRTAELALTETFFQSGLRQQIEASRASARAARYGYDDTNRTLILTVAQSYYTALAAVGLAEVAMRAVADSQLHLDVVDAQISAGTSAKSDRYPFEVQLAQARLSAITAENTAKTSLTSLKNAIGLPSTGIIHVSQALGRPPKEGKLPDLIQEAYDQRPDAKQLNEQVKAAQQNLRVAEINAGPVLTVAGGANYGRYTGVTGDTWQISGGVSVPIFDSGRSKAAIDSARASLQTAQETLRSSQLNISAQVEANYLDMVAADAAIDAAESAYQSAKVSLAVAEEKYKAGLGTVIDVTDAETQFEQTDAAKVQAYYTYNTSLAALKASVGRPLVPAQPK
jgi:outer membrane protein TolC